MRGGRAVARILLLLALAFLVAGGAACARRHVADNEFVPVEPEVVTALPQPPASPSAKAPGPAPSSTLIPATVAASPTVAKPTPSPAQVVDPIPSPTEITTSLDEPGIVAEIVLREMPAVGHLPNAVAVLDGRVYVANMTTANVLVIEGDRVVRGIPVGASPVSLLADPARGVVYVANQGDDSISVVNAGGLVRTLPAGKWPGAMALVGDFLVVAQGDGPVVVVDPETGKQIREVLLDASSEALALAADPVAQHLIVQTYNETHVVDTAAWRVLYKVSLNSYSTLAVSSSSGRFYVTDYDSSQGRQYLVAARASDGELLGRVPIGQDPRGAVVSAAGRVYVANSWTNEVSIVQEEPLSLVASPPVGLHPVAIAVDVATDRVYVANSDGDSISVIDGGTGRVVSIIPLAMNPEAIALDPGRHRAYVVNSSTDSVYVIEEAEIVGELSVGRHPAALALDVERQMLYVANQAEGTCSVLDVSSNAPARTVAVGGNPQAVALNRPANRAYVGDVVIGMESLAAQGRLGLRSPTMGMDIIPLRLLADPERNRIYAIASNGTPGSNGGNIIYALDGSDYSDLGLRFGSLGVAAMALDGARGTLYSASERMGYGYLYAHDALTGEDVASPLETWKRPRSLAYNSTTGHLFAGLTSGARRDVDFAPEILVLDGELQQVASIDYPGNPVAMAVDATRNLVYVCDRLSGRVSLIQDVELAGP